MRYILAIIAVILLAACGGPAAPSAATVESALAGVGAAKFHELVGAAGPLRTVDMLAPLWGVRPLNDGEAVWFEFRVD